MICGAAESDSDSSFDLVDLVWSTTFKISLPWSLLFCFPVPTLFFPLLLFLLLRGLLFFRMICLPTIPMGN